MAHVWLQGCLHHDPVRRWTAERMHEALLSESLDRVAAPAPRWLPPASAPIPSPPLAQAPPPQHIAISLPLQAPPPMQEPPQSHGGQRPTPQTRSLCGFCLVRTCYTFAFVFIALIIITTFSSIFG